MKAPAKHWTRPLALAGTIVAAFQFSGPAHAQDMETIEVNGVTLQYLDQGEGDPVVFVHGGLSHGSWLAYRDLIPQDYNYIAYVQRYFGDQPWPDNGENWSIPTHVDDLIAFVEALDRGPVHLVGWSHGGVVGTHAALERPDLFRSLFFYEPGGALAQIVPGDDAKAAAKARLDAFAEADAAIEAGDLDKGMALMIDAIYRIPGAFADRMTDAQRANLLKNTRLLTVEATAAPPPVTCEQLAALDMPTEIVVGGETWNIYKMIADRLTECMPNAEKLVLQGHTHGAPGLDPELVGDLIVTFLREQRGA